MEGSGSIKEQIRQFVLQNAQAMGVTELKDDQSLVETGLVDSLGVYTLVVFLEETFAIRVDDDEIVSGNFRNIGQIERFVAAKLSQSEERARTQVAE